MQFGYGHDTPQSEKISRGTITGASLQERSSKV
jgi:hypothetical protein